jgi:hypothetical protein
MSGYGLFFFTFIFCSLYVCEDGGGGGGGGGKFIPGNLLDAAAAVTSDVAQP